MVDAIALGVNAPNNWERIGQMSAVAGNLLQQKALGQQINANVAASEAFQRSVDPATGKVDLNRAASLLAQDPRGAYNVPQLMGQIQSQQNAQLENQTRQYELALKQINGLKQNIGALMGNPNLDHGAIISTLGNMVNQGILNADQATQELQTMPQDPSQLRGWVQQHALAVMDADKQLQAISPQIQQVQQGNQTALINTNPFYGQGVGQVAAMPQGMSPGEAASPVNVYNPQTGAPEAITKAQFAARQGVQTAPALGQEEIIKGAAKRYDEQVQGVPDLQNAQQGLEAASRLVDSTMTGPGATTAMKVSGLLNSFGLPVAKDATTNYQELHKYLQNQLNTAMKANGGVKSDTGLETFLGGQPNAESMNPAALKKAIRFVQAQNQGALSRTQAMQDYVSQHGAASLPEFEKNWSKAYNPNVMYMRTLETPQEKAEFWNSLSSKQQESAKKSAPLMGAFGLFNG